LEGALKLRVNPIKTHIAHSDEGIKFLEMVIQTGYPRMWLVVELRNALLLTLDDLLVWSVPLVFA